MVYFITGKSNSGKTTRAYLLKKKLELQKESVVVLDGEEVRERFPTGFSDDERYEHIMRIAKIAAIIEENGIVVIIAMIAPKKQWRQEARSLFKKSCLIHLPGGTLWKHTKYERPDAEEEELSVECD